MRTVLHEITGVSARRTRNQRRLGELHALRDQRRTARVAQGNVRLEASEAQTSGKLVIEAIVEDEGAKVDLFKQLDEIVTSPDAILASNTSSIPIMKLATVTKRPANVLGVHFFNPVPVLKLVELVPSLMTAEETTERARAYVDGELGKHAITCQDRAGFVVNSLLIPFILSAIRMYESGFATAEDIDQGFVLGAAHPQGPLALADLIGLDTTMAVAESLYEEFNVLQEPTAAKGIATARAGLIDLVVMDVGLPDMDGREAVKLLRKSGFKAPVIILTAQDADADTILFTGNAALQDALKFNAPGLNTAPLAQLGQRVAVAGRHRAGAPGACAASDAAAARRGRVAVRKHERALIPSDEIPPPTAPASGITPGA